MSRWLLPTIVLGCTVLTLPGCAGHQDQDFLASSVAQQLAAQPRDMQAQAVLATPKPKLEFQPAKVPQEKLKLPDGLPGIDAPPIAVPPVDPDKGADPQRAKAIDAAYPHLPALEAEFKPGPGPNGQPLDLPALQQIALGSNPLVQQAAADVQAARGVAIQVGLYPNPVAGFEGDSIGQAGSNGQLGGFFDQTIKTAGKLQLARSAGMVDVSTAELVLKRTQADVMSQVRSGYFAVLVAQENLTIARAMAELSDEVYRRQIKMVQGGLAAPYEPVQLEVLAVQARTNVVQARNRYLSAWRQLAASLGQNDMPPTQLAGRADVPAPSYGYDNIRDFIFANHTDVGIANNSMMRSRILLQLAQVTPIPDINTHFVVQNDNTNDPSRVQVGVQLGVAIPIWDRKPWATFSRPRPSWHVHNREVQRKASKTIYRSALADAFDALPQQQRDDCERLPRQHFAESSACLSVALPALWDCWLQPSQVELHRHRRGPADAGTGRAADLRRKPSPRAAVAGCGGSGCALLQTDDIYQITVPGQACAPATPVSLMLDPRTWTAVPRAGLSFGQ